MIYYCGYTGSMETAINSSTDVLFTATADFKRQKREGTITKIDIRKKKTA